MEQRESGIPADLRVFGPRPDIERQRDLVWIGNWGDDERTAELHEYLIEPVASLGLSARVHGVRYPEEARRALAGAGIDFAGYMANFRAPDAFAEAILSLLENPRRGQALIEPAYDLVRQEYDLSSAERQIGAILARLGLRATVGAR